MKPDGGDDKTSVLPRNTHVPPTSGEELGPTSKPVPPTPKARYSKAEYPAMRRVEAMPGLPPLLPTPSDE